MLLRFGYELYRLCYSYRPTIPKQDRHTLWQKSESTLLEVLEEILLASQSPKPAKPAVLERVSVKVNLLRVFFRLAKDVKAIDLKKYAALQERVDEIGRMLGGWIRSTKS